MAKKSKAFVRVIKTAKGFITGFGVYRDGALIIPIEIPSDRRLWSIAYQVACDQRDRLNYR